MTGLVLVSMGDRELRHGPGAAAARGAGPTAAQGCRSTDPRRRSQRLSLLASDDQRRVGICPSSCVLRTGSLLANAAAKSCAVLYPHLGMVLGRRPACWPPSARGGLQRFGIQGLPEGG